MTDTSTHLTIDTVRELVVGLNELVPVADGTSRQYISCDNAASTPALAPVAHAVNEFLRWYSNVHRGTGYKSKVSTWAFEEARAIIARFVHADPASHIVIFCRNATEAINKLARRYPFQPGSVVLTSVMEHHSNELPWRQRAQVAHVAVQDDGTLDMADLERHLVAFAGRVQLVAVTAASNVTGLINPVHRVARLAHQHGAQIMVDGAQLVPHRPMDLKPDSDPEHLDFLAFSGHKMYAPYGVGALIGPRAAFLLGAPDLVGGGSVDIVTLEDAYWTDLPDKEEAGTPDIVGVVALAAAIRVLETIGWEPIIAHEQALTRRALDRLAGIPGVRVYGDPGGADLERRLGVVAFNVGDLPHALVAAVLSYEHAIGVRNGCFCAHPYVKALLRVDEAAAREMEQQILGRDRSVLPGAVRMSFGIYNTLEEVDAVCDAVAQVARGGYREDYVLNRERGEYTLPAAETHPERCFSFDPAG